MSDVLTDMRARLGAVTDYPEVPIALARIPDQPDEVLTLRDYAPGAPLKDRDARGLPAFDSLGLQMVVRTHRDRGVGRALAIAERAYRQLSGRHVLAGGGRYDWIVANALPRLMGFDENDRPLVVVNFSLQRWGDLGAVTGFNTSDTSLVLGDTTNLTSDAVPAGAA